MNPSTGERDDDMEFFRDSNGHMMFGWPDPNENTNDR